jgi:autotransporter-associated beta strand protein
MKTLTRSLAARFRKSIFGLKRNPFLVASMLLLAGSASAFATTDISTLSPAANVTISPSAATDTAWVVSTDTTVGGISWTRTGGGQNFTFNGTPSSTVLTFQNTSTPTFATNSFFNGSLYWGNMHVVAASGINVQTGFNNVILQSGLVWDSGSAGTMTFTQPASDGNLVYAQGSGVLASTMDLNLGSGSKGSTLVINGGTSQTIGALTGTSSDYIGAYSDSSQFYNNITPSGANTTGATSAATLTIGNTGSSATFSGVIGSTRLNAGTVLDNGSTQGINVVKIGSGTQTLNGANTYTGATTINGGTLALGSSGSIGSSSGIGIAAGATLDTTAQTTFTLLSAQTITFTLDPTGSGSAGLIAAAGLDITNAAVDFSTLGTLDDSAYTLATYGSLTGTSFSSVSNLPSGYTIDYNYGGTNNTIALVAVPEPKEFALAVMGLLGVAILVRRRMARFGE